MCIFYVMQNDLYTTFYVFYMQMRTWTMSRPKTGCSAGKNEYYIANITSCVWLTLAYLQQYSFCENIYVAMPSKAIVYFRDAFSTVLSNDFDFPVSLKKYVHVRKIMIFFIFVILAWMYRSFRKLLQSPFILANSNDSDVMEKKQQKKTVTIFPVLLWDSTVLCWMSNECDSFVCIYKRYTVWMYSEQLLKCTLPNSWSPFSSKSNALTRLLFWAVLFYFFMCWNCILWHEIL